MSGESSDRFVPSTAMECDERLRALEAAKDRAYAELLRKHERTKVRLVKAQERAKRDRTRSYGAIADLRALIGEALPNLDGYVVMAAEKPNSLWSRMHAVAAKEKR